MTGINNGVKIRDLYPHNYLRYSEFEEFIGLAYNSIKITCTDSNIPFGYMQENFIKRQLINSNVVGFDSLSKMFAVITAYGFNEYWFPETGNFIFPNGRSYIRKLSYTPNKSGAFLIRGLPSDLSIAQLIKRSTDKIAEGEKTIIQNLQAVKVPFIAVVKNKELRLSMEQAIQQRKEGVPVILTDSTLGEALKGVQTYTDFIAPAVDELTERERARLLNKLGTMTANITKRERVQATEVNATVGQCEDYLYVLIDNVNNQFETFGLPFKMDINTSLEELYFNDNENQNEPEKEVDINV